MRKVILASILLPLTIITSSTQSNTVKPSLLRHVVLFTFKASSSQQDIDKVVAAFAGLPKQISVIKAFEWGLNNSPENFHQGFTHCFILTFASEKDRDAVYQVHPAHKAFQQVLIPHMEKVFVVDYWVKE
jgi:hypothetical protein